jgi:hypothetical protein
MNAATLATKGGMMFFCVERAEKLYRGAVLLSPVNAAGERTRIVCAKVYRYRQIQPEGGLR